MKLQVHRLGRVEYSRATPQQIALKDAVRNQRPDKAFLILVEHTPVITLGRGWKGGNLLMPIEKYREMGFEVHNVSRGGDVTYHGPGQVVAYPVFDLNYFGRDIHQFLHNIEETAIRVLAQYGLVGGRKQGLTGAWVGNSKVCAIGIAVSGWVSYHGLAFNVNPDLRHFGLIVPCGITTFPVASLATLLGNAPTMREVEDKFIQSFIDVFALEGYKCIDDSATGTLSCLDEKGALVLD